MCKGNDTFFVLNEVGPPLFPEGDPASWIYQTELFFELQETPADLKLKLTALGLANEALIW